MKKNLFFLLMMTIILFRPDYSFGSSIKDVFTSIYKSNYWHGKESVSGGGSSLSTTIVIRKELEKLIKDLDIHIFMDAACGDYNWMRYVDLGKSQYIGIDIVPAMIEDNNKKYGRDNRIFLNLNIASDKLPKADLILCRDCLAHLSFEDAVAVLQNFKRSQSRYLLVTTHVNCTNNIDIKTGKYHPYNLALSPFYMPRPRLLIRETSAEPHSYRQGKSMALYMIEDIPDYNMHN